MDEQKKYLYVDETFFEKFADTIAERVNELVQQTTEELREEMSLLISNETEKSD